MGMESALKKLEKYLFFPGPTGQNLRPPQRTCDVRLGHPKPSAVLMKSIKLEKSGAT